MKYYRRCWKTTDGEIFDDEAEAAVHQEKLARCNTIKEILDSPYIRPDLTDHEKAVITDVLMNNWPSWARLFQVHSK